MTVRWNNVAFTPQPTTYRVSYRFIGNSVRTADGTLRVDYVAEKAEIELRFDFLTFSELQSIKTLYDNNKAQECVLRLYDGREFMVLGAQNGFEEMETWVAADGSLRYSVRFRLEEV